MFLRESYDFFKTLYLQEPDNPLMLYFHIHSGEYLTESTGETDPAYSSYPQDVKSYLAVAAYFEKYDSLYHEEYAANYYKKALEQLLLPDCNEQDNVAVVLQIYQHLEKLERAEFYFGEEIALREKRAASEEEWQMIAERWEAFAEYYQGVNQSEQAEICIRKALSIRRDLYSDQTDSYNNCKLAEAYFRAVKKLETCFRYSKFPEDLMLLLQDAIRLCEAACASNDTAFQRILLAECYDLAAGLYRSIEKHDIDTVAAVTYKALLLRQKNAKEDPSAQCQNALARCWLSVAAFECDTEKRVQAFRAAHDIMNEFAAQYPEDSDYATMFELIELYKTLPPPRK